MREIPEKFNSGASLPTAATACAPFADHAAFPATALVAPLGSGLIDHSQKMTAAAMQIAEK
jgi:hypothetical protein